MIIKASCTIRRGRFHAMASRRSYQRTKERALDNEEASARRTHSKSIDSINAMDPLVLLHRRLRQQQHLDQHRRPPQNVPQVVWRECRLLHACFCTGQCSNTRSDCDYLQDNFQWCTRQPTFMENFCCGTCGRSVVFII